MLLLVTLVVAMVLIQFLEFSLHLPYRANIPLGLINNPGQIHLTAADLNRNWLRRGKCLYQLSTALASHQHISIFFFFCAAFFSPPISRCQWRQLLTNRLCLFIAPGIKAAITHCTRDKTLLCRIRHLNFTQFMWFRFFTWKRTEVEIWNTSAM